MQAPIIPTALIIAVLMALQKALEDYPAEWAPIATLVIAAVVQAIRVYWPQEPKLAWRDDAGRGRLRRWLLG